MITSITSNSITSIIFTSITIVFFWILLVNYEYSINCFRFNNYYTSNNSNTSNTSILYLLVNSKSHLPKDLNISITYLF